jgi:L-arabinonolactonase
MAEAEVALDCRNQHGEGVVFDDRDGRLWWTDIDGKALWWLAPASGRSGRIAMPDRVCCFAPRAKGGFLLALAKALAFFDPATGALERFYAYEPDDPETRLNDGRTDRQGRFIAGGMNEGSGRPTASVLQVGADGAVRTILEKVACANSTCFSPDGRRMYFTDTPTRVIWSYDYDSPTGELGARTVLARFDAEPGLPDGSCVDAEGAVWNAEWAGHRVVRILPDGRIDRVIELPVRNPTCCAFGGKKLDILFITTSRQGMSPAEIEAEPLSGSLFRVTPGVRGLVDTPFAG